MEAASDIEAQLSLSRLRKLADETGASAEAIDRAWDREDPRPALIRLIESAPRDRGQTELLREELRDLTRSALRRRALAAGVGEEQLQQVEEGTPAEIDDQLIALIATRAAVAELSPPSEAARIGAAIPSDDQRDIRSWLAARDTATAPDFDQVCEDLLARA